MMPEEDVTFLLKPESWQVNYWDRDNCQIISVGDGLFGVLDHSIQELVATSPSRDRLVAWLGSDDEDGYDNSDLDG